MLASEPEDLSFMLGAHVVRVENKLVNVVFWPPSVPIMYTQQVGYEKINS